MAILEISVVPLGTGSTSVSPFVARMQRVLADSGLPFELSDMGTVVEGKIETLFEISRRLHEVPFDMGAQRVYTVLKIDDRRDKTVHLGEKTASVKAKS